MSTVGFREAVGLVLFVIAIAVAATFLDPSKTNGNPSPRPIAHGDAVPGHLPETPGPLAPSRPMPAPKEWTVFYVEVTPGGVEEIVHRESRSDIDLTFSGSPLTGVPEDGWRLIVECRVDLPEAARYYFVMEQQGEARVFVDGMETEYRFSPDGPRRVTVSFGHDAGPATVRIEATDTGGAFSLAVR